MPDDKEKTVPIDTSGPDATVDIEEVKDESVVETEAPNQDRWWGNASAKRRRSVSNNR